MINYAIIEHPLVSHYLSVLRNKNTTNPEFKESLDKISYLLASFVYETLKTDDITFLTPLKKCKGKTISHKVVLLPILRAGLGLLQGFSTLLPNVTISHIGLYRDEESLRPVKYYFKFPEFKSKDNLKVIILDPMVATGGSSIFTIEYLLNMGIKDINLVSLLCAPEGINAIEKRFNNIQKKYIKIVTCSVDEKLNEKGYILPGLGDAGDRLFGT
ncbi:MAG: uracil phosphoribosyltransferase [Ignavibacteria bacterium]|jgi:uracil phosphoribosyltransferase